MNNVCLFVKPIGLCKATLEQIPQPLAEEPRLEAVPQFQTKISAGFPSPADDYREEPLDFNQYLVNHRASTFVFTVKGESMVAAGIFDGDKVVVDRSVDPQHNHVVIAVVNGEYTVKRLFRRRGIVELRAENPAYQTIKFAAADELTIWGVVVGVIRKLKL